MEFYGAQPPLELIRTWMDHAGWYNRKELTYFQIIDIYMTKITAIKIGNSQFAKCVIQN